MSVPAQKYMVRDPVSGREWGPLEGEEILRQAGSGEVTRACLFRNVLVNNWKTANDIDWLKTAFAAQQVETQGPAPTVKNEGRRVDGRAQLQASLTGPSVFTFTPGSALLRLMAGLFDTAIILFFGLVLSVIAIILGRYAGVAAAALTYLTMIVWYIGSLLYLTLGLACRAQTVGLWFWGLFLVRQNGTEAQFEQAFTHALGSFWLGFTTPFLVFILPSRRGLIDRLCGTRMIRTRILNEDTRSR